MTESAQPDELLLAILFLGGETWKYRFDASSRRLHETMYRLREQYPELLGRFTFTTTTRFPYSDQLASSLQNLAWARILGAENPDFGVYFLHRQECEATYNRMVKHRVEPLLQLLQQASNDFWQAVGIPA